MSAAAVHHVDGLTLHVLDADVQDLESVEGAAVDWRVRFVRGLAPVLPDLEWTGDVSLDDDRWARFARAGPVRLVRLEGVLDLQARPQEGLAEIHPGVRRGPDAYLLRRALPYLAVLAGHMALHAACIAFPEGAVLVCGDSGAGKSTLALALDGAGHAVLGDDHVSLTTGAEGSLRAHASFPRADVTPETHRAFRAVLPAPDAKASVDLQTPRPPFDEVRTVVFLGRGAELATSPLPVPEVATRLLRDVMFVADPTCRDEAARRLEVAARLAELGEGVVLHVPRGLDRLRDALPRLVETLRSLTA